MFKLKFVLPMLAFVLAIGMSFAFTNAYDSSAAEEAVIINGTTYEVSANCPEGSFNCEVQLLDNNGNPIDGEIHQVYGMDANGEYTVPRKSGTVTPISIPASSLIPIE